MPPKMSLAVLLLSVPALGAGTLQRDPVAAVGHGAVLAPDGSEIDPKADFVIEAQLFYIASVYERADDSQRAEFAGVRKQVLLEEMTEEEQILANSALLAWLVEEVKPEDGPYLL